MAEQFDNEPDEEETKIRVNGGLKELQQMEEALEEDKDEEEYDECDSVTVEDSKPVSQCNDGDPSLEVTEARGNANSMMARTESTIAGSGIRNKRRRDVNGVTGGDPTEEVLVSKKTKVAIEENSAQPKKGQQQKQHQQRQQEGGWRKSKKALVFRYGNYHNYYGYRLAKTVDEDPRLKCFRREWFEGKECLDVGCNEGLVTISIAQKYSCRSILGVDIDHFLIKKAIRNLEEAAVSSDDFTEERLENGLLEETSVLRSCDNTEERCGEIEVSQRPVESDAEMAFACSESLLQKVKFRQEHFIEDFPHGDFRKDGTFDTVLCLSVTKWVHMNWGDSGLIRLFAKIHHILRPGGIFILEPQPWKSYEKKYFVSEVTKRGFENIRLTPEHFKEVLLEKIGFKSVEEISKAVPNSTVGFDRSLFLYVK